MYTYHTHSPFIIDDKKGLTYDFAEYLNTHSEGIYHFEVIPMSRARVDKMLQQGEVGIIPWVNPSWFLNTEELEYMWTDSVLMEDGNAVISGINTGLQYSGPESVRNLIFGAVRGHHYAGIDDYVNEGKIKRVDDEDYNRELGQEILESLGYKVLVAENGQEAVELFDKKKSEIDIVIMDMMMPVMNGSEAFLKMKKIDEHCSIIISSGYINDAEIDELKRLGITGFINKPYKISELSQLLKDTMDNN